MDSDTFERETRRAAGGTIEPRPVPDLGSLPDEDPDPEVHPARLFRCETPDGHPVEATEAFANALVGRLRRTVVGGNGVMLDQPGATGCSPGHGRIHVHRPDGTQVG